MYAPASTATAITRRRMLGFWHQERGPGRVTEGGAGMDAIALKPSEVARRLPAVEASRTIPRHVGPVRRARVAGLRPPRYAGDRDPPRRGAPHGVLRLRSDRARPAARQSHADHAAAALPARRPQAHRADGRRHRPDRRSERQAQRAAAALEGADPRASATPSRP